MPRGQSQSKPQQDQAPEGAGENAFGSFEFWQPSRGMRTARESTCSVSPNGIISVAADLARYLLNERDRGKVQLGYNTKEQQVLIASVSNGAGRTLGRTKGQRYHLSAKPFLEMHHVLPDQRVEKECERIESGGQRGIVFSLP